MSRVSGTMTLAPAPVQQFFDNNGQPLVGGLLFAYAAGTTTKQSCFTDSTGATPLPNPIVLNVRGEVAPSAVGTSCGLWTDPSLAYKFVLAEPGSSDPPSSSIWSVDNIISPLAATLAALAAYEADIAGVPVGGMTQFGGTTAPNGWLLCYGQPISRTTYALLFGVIGTAYGVGDGTTTFNLPDLRGRVAVGLDNMGGSPANRITNAVCGITGTTMGAAGGDQHAQADTLSAVSAASAGLSDPGHAHVIHTVGNGGGTPVGEITGVSGANAPNGTTQTAYTNITVSVSVSTTVTSSLTGASQNVQPSQIATFIIYTGVSS
jgi:microcystin-dependent protein